MIKLNISGVYSRLATFLQCSFPTLIVLLIFFTEGNNNDYDCIYAVAFISLNLVSAYSSLYYYDVFFDEKNKMIVLKKFNSVITFDANEEFEIKPYIFPISIGLQFFKLSKKNKNYRIKYSFTLTGYSPFIDLDELSRSIKNEMLKKILI
jgi:hypothetical protein